MSSFRMFNHHSKVSGRNQPIAYEAGNIEIRFVKKTTKQKKKKKTEPVCLSAWRVDWLTSIHASCLTTVVSQNERMYVHVFVWVCVHVSECRSMCLRVFVFVSGMTLGYAVKMIKWACSSFFFFFLILIPLFVSATTLIHSILLFITKWLLTKLLYALRGAHTNVLITPSPIVEGSIHMQVTHKVGFIEFCYIFLTFVLLQRNTPCHCMKPATVFGVLNALLHLLKMKSKWLSQALI